jgi:glycopeptide antibiotics resistance protein
MTGAPTTERVYAAIAAVFIAFAVWGSLFPFDFHPVSWRDAAASFWSPSAVPVSRWSISDFVSNVLLFVPIGLFGVASLATRSIAGPGVPPGAGALKRRPYVWVAVIAASAVLSTTIELAQAVVPWRTPSVVDVGAEIVGAACGIVAWTLVHRRLDGLVAAAVSLVRRSSLVERMLLVYCALFAVAWLVPADFTLRPNEIADKYVHKRLLLPFTPSPDAATARDLTMIGAAALPIGVTATLCGCGGATRRPVLTATLVATTFLIALEAAQIFVFSRTTDGTAFAVASAAAAAAAVLAGMAGRRPVSTARAEGR